MGVSVVKDDALDFANRPAGELARKPTVAESQKHVLELFDKNVAALRAAIVGASDEHWGKNWKLSAGEKTFYNGPRMGAMRRMVMNHVIHHRAQLGVYLRLNDVAVPRFTGLRRMRDGRGPTALLPITLHGQWVRSRYCANDVSCFRVPQP